MITTGGKIRVLVADDSAFMRKVLVSILESEGAFAVVGEARDGQETVDKAASLKPDVITMDINMPHLDGLAATEMIMSTNPRPILIVSSESKQGADATLHALALGAVDFVAKPTSGIDLDMAAVREELVRKLRIASKVRVVRNLAAARRLAQEAGEVPAQPILPAGVPHLRTETQLLAGSSARLPIAVLAASTGGPATLMKLIPDFAANFPGALLVVQHMPGGFTEQFAAQLAAVSSLPVKHAVGDELLEAGCIYVCPGNCHLRVVPPGRIVLDNGPRIGGYRPCIDVTLESVASLAGPNAVAAILTGMGADGARGAQAVHENGGLVLAQDEATAVIFGMPLEAIRTGAVHHVLPLHQIAAAITRRLLLPPSSTSQAAD